MHQVKNVKTLNWQSIRYVHKSFKIQTDYLFNSVQSLSHVRLLVITARQASLSITNSWESQAAPWGSSARPSLAF